MTLMVLKGHFTGTKSPILCTVKNDLGLSKSEIIGKVTLLVR